MITLAARIIAVALTLSVALGSGVNLLAWQAPEACRTAHHDCDRMTRMSKCDACHQADDASQAATRVEVRTEFANSSSVATLPAGDLLAPAAVPRQTSEAYTRLLDRPILFGVLLI